MVMNVILYTRVSTKEQADHGYSLRYQKDFLINYCNLKKWNILIHFEEDYSAKDFNRPEFKKLWIYLKANKKSIDAILFTRWDRFSRDQFESLRVIKELVIWGIQVISAEQPLDMSIPENKLVLSWYLTLPEVENDKNSIRTKEGMRKAKKEGYWVGSAPFGYNNSRTSEKKPTLKINEKGELVRKAFKEMSKGIYSAEEIRKTFSKKGLTLNKQAFLNMLRNPVYIGKIYMGEWKKEEATIVEGFHEAIVTDDVFKKVNEVLSGKRFLKVKHIKQNDSLFLRGYLLCPVCSKNLTGSPSKGNGGRYFYYHCNNNNHHRFRADKANKDFILFLTSFRPPQNIVYTYQEVLREIAKEKGKEKVVRIKSIQSEIEKIEEQLQKAEDRYINDDLEKSAYQRISERYNASIRELRKEKEEMINTETKFETHIKFGVNLLTHLSNIFQHMPIEIKQKIIGLFFPEKLHYENGTYRTTKINRALELFAQLSSDSGGYQMKQAGISTGLSTQAPPPGLEPGTL